MRLIKASQATAAKRRVYFHIVGTDGITPATGEAGEQPQISVDGAAWQDTGIGVLVAIGNGRYYATLTEAIIGTAGQKIETRYKSASTAECPGESAQIVGFDPDSDIATIKKVLEADIIIDTGATPWQAVYIERGTGALGVGTELLRKDLKSAAGADITSIDTVIGQAVAP